MIKRIFLLLSFFLVLPTHAKKIYQKKYLIAHAGGSLENAIYLNCFECVENALKNGSTYIELDLRETSDGHIVALHDWPRFHRLTNHINETEPLTLQDFQKRKLLNKYTPLSISEINTLMLKYPNWILIVDKYKNFEKLLKQLPFPDRIMIEITSVEDYRQAVETGVMHPVYATYLSPNANTNSLYKQLKEKQIKSVSINEKFYLQNKEFVLFLKKQGIEIILFAPNLQKDTELIKKEVGTYFDLIYSDFCFPNKPCQ